MKRRKRWTEILAEEERIMENATPPGTREQKLDRYKARLTATYVQPDDAALSWPEFLHYVRDRISDDLGAAGETRAGSPNCAGKYS